MSTDNSNNNSNSNRLPSPSSVRRQYEDEVSRRWKMKQYCQHNYFFEDDGVTPLDLSDVTPKIQIRKGGWNGKLYKTATIGDGISWVDQSQGQLDFGGFLASWDGAGEYYYDIQFTTGTTVKTWIGGYWVVQQDVTT